MFGQLIEGIEIYYSPLKVRDNFYEKCMELNKHRIDIVHRLTKRSS